MKKVSIFFPLLFLTTTLIAQQVPTNKLEDLFFLTGTWKIITETRLSANGPWETTEASATVVKTVGGTMLEENYTGTRQTKPFIAKTLMAVNNQTQKLQRFFIDSEHGVIVDFEGGKNGDSLVFDKTWTYANKSTVKLRVVYKLVSPTEFIIESMRMPESMTTWDVTGRMRYRKQ